MEVRNGVQINMAFHQKVLATQRSLDNLRERQKLSEKLGWNINFESDIETASAELDMLKETTIRMYTTR